MEKLFDAPPEILQGMAGQQIHSLFLSADRSRIVAGLDPDIPVWQLNEGVWALLCTLAGGAGDANVRDVVFVDERGRFVLSGGSNRIIIHWDVDHRQQLFVFSGHTNTVWSLALLRGTDVFFSASEDRTVRVWDISQRTQLGIIPVPNQCFDVAIRPNGRQLAVSGLRILVVKDISACLSSSAVFNVGRMTEVAATAVEETYSWTISYSPDGRLLARGSSDETVKLYNADDNNYPLIRTLQGHSSSIFSVAFDRTSRYLFSSSSDNTVKIWDVEEGRCVKTLTHHTDTVRSINLSADGSLLVSSSWDGTVAIIPRGIDVEALFGDIKNAASQY